MAVYEEIHAIVVGGLLSMLSEGCLRRLRPACFAA